MVLGLASGKVSLAEAHDTWAVAYERLVLLHSGNREAYQQDKGHRC
jgi:hypothetical protein